MDVWAIGLERRSCNPEATRSSGFKSLLVQKNNKKRRLAARACDDSIVSSMEGISNGEVMVRDLLDYDVPWLKHRTYKKYAKD
jgi:hypothetical protein